MVSCGPSAAAPQSPPIAEPPMPQTIAAEASGSGFRRALRCAKARRADGRAARGRVEQPSESSLLRSPAPEDRPLSEPLPGAHLGPSSSAFGTHTASGERIAPSIVAPAPRCSATEGGAVDRGRLRDRAARTHYRTRADRGPGADGGTGPHLGARTTLAVWMHLGFVVDQQPVAAHEPSGRGFDPALRMSSSPAGSGRGSYVHPVPIQAATVRPSPTRRGKDLALDRDGHVGRDQVEHRALKEVGAGVDLVGVDLGWVGF